MPAFQLLQQLPEELLQETVQRLEKTSLSQLSLVSRWCYSLAIPHFWQDVELVDCHTNHGEQLGIDGHDDTPLIRKLLIFATKPHIASCVQTLTHRCHLPPPAIFNELPKTTFSAQTLSTDHRTILLVKAAARHLSNLQTLRIVFGHPNLNDALLRCLFDKHRSRNVPIRKLWLENCRLSAGCQLSMDDDYSYILPPDLDFQGLESIRFRRLPLRPGTIGDNVVPMYYHEYSRGIKTWELQDGTGGQYWAQVNQLRSEQAAGAEHFHWQKLRTVTGVEEHGTLSPLVELFTPALRFDDLMYDGLREQADSPAELSLLRAQQSSIEERAVSGYRGSVLDPIHLHEHNAVVPIGIHKKWQRERLPSADVALGLLNNARSCLTSLTLDWVMTMPESLRYSKDPKAQRLWASMFLKFFDLRFPNLKVFQFRNAVVPDSLLPQGLFLLDHSHLHVRHESADGDSQSFALEVDEEQKLDLACLSWMEAHQNLVCLAWPMDRFFSEEPMRSDVTNRVEAVIANLGRTLIDLRVDALYSGVGEQQSESVVSPDWKCRDRRRRFTQLFASKMTTLQSIKLEGGIPRDERREVVRALHACPLEKIVMIGVCCPLGNTWGFQGEDLSERLSHGEVEDLAGEDEDVIWQLGFKDPQPPGHNFKLDASYGWSSSPPMAHVIASCHAETVTELKFCGYKGAPVLLSPTPITAPVLDALKHFHNLRTLILSLWLSTTFEGAPRDPDIISYWLNARSPSSTALVRVTDEEPAGWEKELRTKYAPDALAWRITSFIGPFLSERAKSRKGGMHVRASFCIGDWGGIFDVDIVIGKGAMGSDICLSFKGPREELEPERRRSKLENRRWF